MNRLQLGCSSAEIARQFIKIGDKNNGNLAAVRAQFDRSIFRRSFVHFAGRRFANLLLPLRRRLYYIDKRRRTKNCDLEQTMII
jgi:hypothetical protein